MKLLTCSSALMLISALPVTADINFSLGSGGLKATDANNDIVFKMGGRLQLDYSQIQADLDGQKSQTVENDFLVRRARIFAAGTIQDWGFKAQFNLGDGNGGSPEDLYIRYNGFGSAAKITLGKQKEPFSLEELESSKDISMLERSAIVEAYSPGRNYGVSVAGDWGYGVYAVGVFEDDSAEDDKLTANHPSVTARFVYNPIQSDDSVVHVGVSYSHRANEVSLRGVELGTSVGAFHAQAEYLYALYAGGDKDQDNEGYYLQAGYILTQEHRGYKNGVFKRVKPSTNAGAWELVARYDAGFGKYSDFGLGSEEGQGQAYSLGVNWYANNNVKLGLDYGHATLDDSDDKGSSVRLRTQLVW